MFLSYAPAAGHALIDRELYLPRSWSADPAGAPRRASWAKRRSRPSRGWPAAWVTGDEVYGADPGLRAELERRRIGYVLAVAATPPGGHRCGHLCRAAATEHTRHPPPPDQIPLVRNEIAALFGTLIIEPGQDTRHRLRWSTWRRRRQHRAKSCHYQRQARQL